MEVKFTEEEILELENQLSCPSGLNGIEIGTRMNTSNFEMTKKSIDALDLDDRNSVLELGHGNCGHLELITAAADEIKYYGLEVSETMWQEAQKIATNGQVEFRLYDGRKIPYPDNYFDRIFTVNTIYFWSDAGFLIKEIARTLKDEGILILTFADKSFMKNLPFVGQKFKLFDTDDIYNLVDGSGLEVLEIMHKADEVKSKMGELVNRKFTVVKLTKKQV